MSAASVGGQGTAWCLEQAIGLFMAGSKGPGWEKNGAVNCMLDRTSNEIVAGGKPMAWGEKEWRGEKTEREYEDAVQSGKCGDKYDSCTLILAGSESPQS